jgi:hypothetical protein
LGCRRTQHCDKRRGVDDGTTPGTAECRNPVFAAEKNSFQIDGQRQFPNILLGVDGIVVLGMHDSSIVEQDI